MASSSGSSYASSIETTNYARMCRIVIDVLRDILWQVLTNEILPADLPKKVQTDKKKLGKLDLKIKTWLCGISPPSTEIPSAEKFDVSSLYTLIRNLCSQVPAPSTQWGQIPPAGGITLGDDIERVRQFRNTLYGHATQAKIETAYFNKLCIEIKDVASRFDTYFRSLSKAMKCDFQCVIDTILTCFMDKSLEDDYIEKMKEIATLSDCVVDVQQKLGDLTKTVYNVEDVMYDLQKDGKENAEDSRNRLCRIQETLDMLHMEKGNFEKDKVKDTTYSLVNEERDCNENAGISHEDIALEMPQGMEGKICIIKCYADLKLELERDIVMDIAKDCFQKKKHKDVLEDLRQAGTRRLCIDRLLKRVLQLKASRLKIFFDLLKRKCPERAQKLAKIKVTDKDRENFTQVSKSVKMVPHRIQNGLKFEQRDVEFFQCRLLDIPEKVDEIADVLLSQFHISICNHSQLMQYIDPVEMMHALLEKVQSCHFDSDSEVQSMLGSSLYDEWQSFRDDGSRQGLENQGIWHYLLERIQSSVDYLIEHFRGLRIYFLQARRGSLVLKFVTLDNFDVKFLKPEAVKTKVWDMIKTLCPEYQDIFKEPVHLTIFFKPLSNTDSAEIHFYLETSTEKEEFSCMKLGSHDKQYIMEEMGPVSLTNWMFNTLQLDEDTKAKLVDLVSTKDMSRRNKMKFLLNIVESLGNGYELLEKYCEEHDTFLYAKVFKKHRQMMVEENPDGAQQYEFSEEGLQRLFSTWIDYTVDPKDDIGHVKQQVGNVNQKVGDVKDQVGDVKNQVGDVKDQVGDVKDQVGDEKDQVGGVKDQVVEWNVQVGDVKNLFGDVKYQVGDVNDQVGDVKDQVGGVKDQVDDVKDQVGGLKDEVGEWNVQIGDVKDQVGDVKDHVGDVKDQVGDVKDQVGDVNDQVGEWNVQGGDVKDQVGDVKDQVGDVKDQVHEVKDQVGDVKDQVGDVKDQVHEVKDQVGDVKDQVGDVKDQVGEWYVQGGDVKDQVGDVKDQVGDVKDHVGDVNDHVGDVKDQVREWNVQGGDVKDQVGDVKDQVGDVKDQVGDVKDHVGDVKDQVGDVKDHVEDVKDHVGDVKDQVGEWNVQGGDVKDQVGDVKDQVGDVKDQVGDVKDQVGDVKDQVGEWYVQGGDVKDQVGDVKDQVGDVKDQVGDVKDHVGDVKDHVGDVKDQVGEWNVQGGDVKDHVGDVKDQVGDVKDQVGDVKGHVGDVKDHVGDVEDQVGEWNVQGGDVKDHVGDVKDQVGDVKDQVGDVKYPVGDVKDHVGDVKDQVGDVKDQVHEVKDQVGDVKDQVGDVKDQVGDVKDQVGEWYVQGGDVKDQVGDVKDQVGDVKDQVGDVKDHVGDVKDHVGDVKDQVGEWNVQGGDVKDHVGDVKDQVGDVKDQVGDVKYPVGDVKDHVGDVEDQVGEWNVQGGDVKDQVGDVKDQVGDVKDQVHEVKDQVGEVKDQVGDVKDHVGDVKDQVGDVKDQIHEEKVQDSDLKKDFEVVQNALDDVQKGKEEDRTCSVEKEDMRSKEQWLMSYGSDQPFSLNKNPSHSSEEQYSKDRYSSLPPILPDNKPTERQLGRISMKIGFKSVVLGQELGLSQADIHQIQKVHPHTATQCVMICFKWMLQSRDKATFRNLEKALKHAGIDADILGSVNKAVDIVSCLPPHMLDMQPEDKHLNRISSRIETKHVHLGVELEVPLSTIEQILTENLVDVHRQCFEIMKEWRQRKVWWATFRNLEKAFICVGINPDILKQSLK